MSLIERTSSDQTGVRFSFWAGMAAFAGSLTRFVKNRMAVRYMTEMDDAQLKDIGLSRHDVNSAFMAAATEDPMAELRKAAEKRSARMIV